MIHVLKDEKLGVDREYVAVDRNAEVGEKIIVTFSRDFPEGFIANVREMDDSYDDGSCYLDKDHRGEDYLDGALEEYDVLEPTDIVHIDGERYRLEDPEKDAIKFTMEIGGNPVNIAPWDATCGPIISGGGETYKLTPVIDDHEEEEPKESDVITVLANLGAEVAELKRTVARHQVEINALHEDKVRLGEQLAKVAADIGSNTKQSGSLIAEILIGLKKAGL
ncbi:hypothetical protein IEE86_16770 [Bacillus sp. 28A-2]|uniref:hypothetical protein n=1 Tax=Bacillus sp. 28A-2 TaxID=2772252 RepID=UPI00168CF311|nr:hypothetical protein [Bacillus sp. 28A-2]MBD3861380.1 hypothetical protein [Bacillus sp. 28A-2]